jgi:hypothetical protein
MSSIICRLYESHEQATSVAAELKRNGFSEDWIHIVGTPEPAEGAPAKRGAAAAAQEAAIAFLMKAGVSKQAASVYVKRIRGNGTAVIVLAPFGTAAKAKTILSQFNPTDLGVPDVYRTTFDYAAPFSSFLGWPVLFKSNSPAPFSDWLGWRVLSIDQKSLTKLMNNPAPFSNWLGWSLLSKNPAPFSDFMSWKLLSKEATPLSNWLGWSVLLKSPAPMSEQLGMATSTKR